MKTILKDDYDHLAPDGSEIRLLASSDKGGLCHCTLPVGKFTTAVSHRSVTELWYFIDGSGEVWKKAGDQEELASVASGVSLSIYPGESFQFRNIGDVPLKFIIATIPPWPGSDEAVSVEGKWS